MFQTEIVRREKKGKHLSGSCSVVPVILASPGKLLEIQILESTLDHQLLWW